MESSSPVASSSSSVTSVLPLPKPGKSILKKAPPPQPRFFSISALTKLLPAPGPGGSLHSSTPLKRAHFILPSLQTVYAISTANPPSFATLKEEKRVTEQLEAERRRTVVRGNSYVHDTNAWWSTEKVAAFYQECCYGREEPALPELTAALKIAGQAGPTRTVDLSGIQLTPHASRAFADILTVEWGLRKLVMKECNLEDASLKPILHALLITDTLSFLSIASNRRLKNAAWRLLGVYLGKSATLQFLDISSNILDKKCVEYLVASLHRAAESSDTTTQHTTLRLLATTKPPAATSEATHPLVSLRLDDCSLRPGALDVLAHAVRTSTLRNLSLRLNRIATPGGVALALIIKDYPDAVNSSLGGAATSLPSSPVKGRFPSEAGSTSTDLSTRLNGSLKTLSTPPRHPAALNPQSATTYTPYVPRSKRPSTAPSLDQNTSNGVPLITSSAQGGVTTRHAGGSGPSAALLDNIRALDSLPRIGTLKTLDLRGNELRGGVSYLAQVLKRNRTLKVLNLSDNKIDMTGLLAIAEALKYNSCLETLDLSRNPCSGPGLEGITSLRTAFTLNTSLKRLFLSATALTSDGAIALAEFLPESRSLYHLDLTSNPGLDLAGIVALNAGLKKNFVIRCLDLNIPPGEEELSRLCREILNSCVRNTEIAEESARKGDATSESSVGRGLGKGVWAMIEDSILARSFREKDGKQTTDMIVQKAMICLQELESSSSSHQAVEASSQSSTADVLRSANEAQTQLSALIPTLSNQKLLEDLLQINDELVERIRVMSLLVSNTTNPPRDKTVTVDTVVAGEVAVNGDDDIVSPRLDKGKGRAEPEPEVIEKVLSPTFSIVDSEDEEEEHGSSRGTLHLGEMPKGDAAAISPEGIALASPIERYSSNCLPNSPSLSSPLSSSRSRLQIEEEGEIFRKGQALLGPEELEGEFAGEQLRRELLEAQVERPPQRQLSNEDEDELKDLEPLNSPKLPSSDDLPRPRLSRSRSSSLDNLTPT